MARTALVSTAANPLAEAWRCRYRRRGYSSTSSRQRRHSLISTSHHFHFSSFVKQEDTLVYYTNLSFSLSFLSFLYSSHFLPFIFISFLLVSSPSIFHSFPQFFLFLSSHFHPFPLPSLSFNFPLVYFLFLYLYFTSLPFVSHPFVSIPFSFRFPCFLSYLVISFLSLLFPFPLTSLLSCPLISSFVASSSIITSAG